MTAAKILVVDDDPAIRNLILRFLSQKNFQMQAAQDGKTALATFEQFNPDLVILDVNLPDALGYNLCQQMQSRTDVFVLLLTSRSDAADKNQGFQQGADDYITKPFDLQELENRVRAILKRKRAVTATEAERLVFEHLVIDPGRREVTINEILIPLTALEFDLLHFLACHPGRVLRRSELIQEVWEYDYVGDQRVVDVHIGQIRRKIEVNSSDPSLIQTVRGVGYKFEAPSTKKNEKNGKSSS
ncbi:response regulator transcription factor [Moorena sp. SIO3H5]|uniref:response regulator transcription factor n=1 Tax=Moorena sp. SIO3H5 TaxID=2607834 RepID=UPI0013BE1B52|nr:response regulator transcription factor [Moorena sp. SIO3H5]NEO71570.1 response regulator transcription factor [Moorena sp. SIO3H5]NEP48358.1 response regulator transcription factor [Moorena sp. SIO3C2]NEQ81299.1 response regulator transcription factor [Moorena sp. SIO2I5]